MLLPGPWLERAVEELERWAPGTGGQVDREEACQACPKRNGRSEQGGDPGPSISIPPEPPWDSGEVGTGAVIQKWVPS